MDQEFDQVELSSLAPIELAETPTLEIEAELRQHVFGQDEALRLVAQAIVRNRARIIKDGRPIGSFLFYGPTGVGKTELSKALAAFMFGDPDSERRVAIDMSEFSQAHTIARFVGSPPGYIGSSEHSAIPHELFKKGETILVLDEIEKAHPDIIQLFLGVTEEGRLSARNGSRGHETINFENTVVIFTSNAGSAELAEAQTTRAIGFHGEATRPDLNRVGERALRRRFSPEFLNRVDRVMFKPLELDSHLRIIDKLLVDLNNAVMMSNAPLVWMSEAAKCLLLSRANTQQYHGRDIRRVFKADVEHKLSEFYLSRQLDQRCNLVIDAVNSEYVYRAFPVSSDR